MHNSHTNVGMSFFEVLTVIFVVLKLVGVINWSWLWVLAPIWIPLSIILVICFVIAIIKVVLKRRYGVNE